MQAIDVPEGKPTELFVVAVKKTVLKCKMVSTRQSITFRKVHDEVEGEILTILPSKSWRSHKTHYMTGEIKSRRIDIPALHLEPLALHDMWMWDPADEYWGEPDDSTRILFTSIIDFGPRKSYEMEQIIPFEDPDDPISDPIIEASDYQQAGYHEEALRIMEKVITADLRCLDAHAHLGNWDFNSTNEPDEKIIDRARRHYEVGAHIGELSLGKDFNGVLAWGHIDNRPYLRCMHGYGLSLWRLGQTEEARKIFLRMLWLNPSDNQGIRFLLAGIDDGKNWYDYYSR